MKKVAYSLVLAAGLASSSVMAADMAVKAPPAAAPPPSPWDIVVTAALMTDYNFRGISQSNHKPSTQAGFELRYNWASNWQSYGGISGESINFPNNAAAEVDFYGGIRPTFDKLALDFGAWYYYYPGGQCFNTSGALHRARRWPGGDHAGWYRWHGAESRYPAARRQRRQAERQLLGSLRQGHLHGERTTFYSTSAAASGTRRRS